MKTEDGVWWFLGMNLLMTFVLFVIYVVAPALMTAAYYVQNI